MSVVVQQWTCLLLSLAAVTAQTNYFGSTYTGDVSPAHISTFVCSTCTYHSVMTALIVMCRAPIMVTNLVQATAAFSSLTLTLCHGLLESTLV